MFKNKILKQILVALLWLGVWQIAATCVAKEILLPTPAETLNALISLAKTGEFYTSVLLSILRILSGYILGILFGVLGAVLAYNLSWFDALTSPIIKIIKSVPVASFIILALVWIKSYNLPVFICFLMVMPMIWSTVQSGLENIDKKYLDLAKVYRFGKFKTFFSVKLPFILPAFVSTALTALGFAWKSGIAAEVICRPKNSIGNLLQEAKLYLITPNVFALTAVVVALSMLIEYVVRRLLRRYTDDKY